MWSCRIGFLLLASMSWKEEVATLSQVCVPTIDIIAQSRTQISGSRSEPLFKSKMSLRIECGWLRSASEATQRCLWFVHVKSQGCFPRAVRRMSKSPLQIKASLRVRLRTRTRYDRSIHADRLHMATGHHSAHLSLLDACCANMKHIILPALDRYISTTTSTERVTGCISRACKECKQL